MVVREETKGRGRYEEYTLAPRPPGPPKPLVERAFELARSGAFTRVETIERALYEEGYARGSAHWNSGTLRRQLRRACLTALKAMAAEPQP